VLPLSELQNFEFPQYIQITVTFNDWIHVIVFHFNKFKEEFIKMKNYDRNQLLIPEGKRAGLFGTGGI
jgi:hypothetical protein